MITYRHTIWLRHFNNFKESKYFYNLKILAFCVALLTVIFLFANKITSTIDSGLKTQARIDKVAADLAQLEKENKQLKYEKNLYLSDSEIDAQYRELAHKKKEGETVLAVSFADRKTEETTANNEELIKTEQQVVELRNWEKWISLLFE